MTNVINLCGVEGCRLPHGHRSRKHDPYPKCAWSFLDSVDRDKIEKAGYATPRGGAKGAYQNHVVRSNRVIIPFERLNGIDLTSFSGGYVIRLFPEQYFESSGVLKPALATLNPPVIVGENAFVLYGSYQSLDTLPPLAHWTIRKIEKDGVEVSKRSVGIVDTGHYVLRLPRLGRRPKVQDGAPQGIFAPEYASKEMNFLSRCVLAWLIVHTVASPYTTTQAAHLKAILDAANVVSDTTWERKGVLSHGITTCPLCLRTIKHNELREMISLEDEDGLGNSGIQVEGATRSTIVNLFHLEPLSYSQLDHKPDYVSWGHATCNTRLGQRKCYSLDELREQNIKLGIIGDDGIETFGWMSPGWEFIRSPQGSVWIRISTDQELGAD